MKQVLHICPDCDWRGDGDRCRDLCPNCGCLHVKNEVNPNGEAVNDSRPTEKPGTTEFQVGAPAGVYSEYLCMLAR